MTRKYRYLTDEQAAELRGMYEVARRVGGWMPPDHPDRQVSVRYSALLASYVKDGYTRTELAWATGCSASSIRTRLVRHGHLPAFPSEQAAVSRYQGSRTPYEARRRVRGRTDALD